MNEPIKIITPQDRLNQKGEKPAAQELHLENILGFIEVVAAAPAGIPKKFWDSIKIFNDTGVYYLYVYAEGIGWKSTLLT